MIETELLTCPLEGKDKFIAEMKTFNVKISSVLAERSGVQNIYCIVLCTPGMGVNLWGVSPLYVNPVNGSTLT
jgi:hypothetical protein